jgi:WD40 repeat protein
MGLIKVWEVEDRDPANTSVRATPKGELQPHRTGVTGIIVAGGYVWSCKDFSVSCAILYTLISRRLYKASLDSTLQIQPFTLPPTTTPSISLPHPKLLRALLLLHPASPYLLTAAGDVVRVYSLPDPDPDTGDLAVKADEVELMGEVDAHYHDVTAICVWSRVREDGQEKEEWIVSGSLDGTIRKWKLSGSLSSSVSYARQFEC